MSSSDESADEDYVPGAEESSANESSGESEGGTAVSAEVLPLKRKRAAKNVRSTRARTVETGRHSSDESSSEDEETAAAKQARAASLYESLKQDCSAQPSKQPGKTPTETQGEVTRSQAVGGSDRVAVPAAGLSSKATDEPTPVQDVPSEPVHAKTKQTISAASLIAGSSITSRLQPSLRMPSKGSSASVLSTSGSSLTSRLQPAMRMPANDPLAPSESKSNISLASQRDVGDTGKRAGTKASSSGAMASFLKKREALKTDASTLEKSHTDWVQFKQKSGIAEDLKLHNKDGYLEKQDFLKRAELRQWEKERTVRMGKPKPS